MTKASTVLTQPIIMVKLKNILGKLKNSEKQKIIISSKAGFIDRKLRNFDQLYLEKEIGKSLKKLKTDSIDIFYLNKPNKTEIKKKPFGRVLPRK